MIANDFSNEWLEAFYNRIISHIRLETNINLARSMITVTESKYESGTFEVVVDTNESKNNVRIYPKYDSDNARIYIVANGKSCLPIDPNECKLMYTYIPGSTTSFKSVESSDSKQGES